MKRHREREGKEREKREGRGRKEGEGGRERKKEGGRETREKKVEEGKKREELGEGICAPTLYHSCTRLQHIYSIHVGAQSTFL